MSVAAEYEVVESLSSAQGQPMDKSLADLRAQGVNALVLGEETIAEQIGQGRLSIVSVVPPEGKPVSYLKFNDLTVLPRVIRGLRTRFHELAGPLTPRGNTLILPEVSQGLVRTTSIGLDPAQVRIATNARMIIVARYANPMGVSARTVVETLTWGKEMGVSVFLPMGDQVLGRRESVGTLIETLDSLGIRYASPEFAKIGGDTEVVEKEPGNVIRLHSAQLAELDKLSPVDAVDRYAKAARERNMRMLLVRPLTLGADQPLSAYADFVRRISQEITKSGGVMGAPHPFHAPKVPRLLFVLLGLAMTPAVWFAGSIFTRNKQVLTAGAIVVALLGLACYVTKGQQIMALVGSMAFPIVSFALLERLRPKNVFLGFVMVSAISLVGGLCVAGLLNDLPFYVKAKEFMGIKVSVFIPILLIGLYSWMQLTDWRKTLKSPLTWGTIALSVAVAAALGVMISRTGNDGAVGASDGEIIFRNVLDRVLYVRPRTKEFLIGHPLLIIAIGLLSTLAPRPSPNPGGGVEAAPAPSGRAGWTVLALMLGAMGQTSVVNTLCHLHIPVMLSLARIIEGLVIGCIIGLLAWSVLRTAVFAKEQN